MSARWRVKALAAGAGTGLAIAALNRKKKAEAIKSHQTVTIHDLVKPDDSQAKTEES